MGLHRRTTPRHRVRRVLVPACLLLAVLGLGAPSGAYAQDDEAVVSGSGADLTAWQARAENGPVGLRRVLLTEHPAGETTAVEVRRREPAGAWSQLLADLHGPAGWFEVGRTYRMQAYVRDLNASGEPLGMLLANRNYRHRPSPVLEQASFDDTSWHLVSRTFVCTDPSSVDTALYFDLPTTAGVRWQITAASVRQVEVSPPPTVPGPATRVLRFDGPAGAPPDAAEWGHDVGAGWGDGQRQRYTADTANAAVDGAGHLVITARRDDASAEHPYTSARLTTQGRVSVLSGSYVEARIRAPVGAGVWPAFWLLGDNIGEVGWPACGELDVLEVLGSEPTVVRSATHQAAVDDPTRDVPYGWDDAGGRLDLGQPLDRVTHTYGVWFDDRSVRFYVDRRVHMTMLVEDAGPDGRTWPFGGSFFILLNVAVGGLEDPSGTTFPRSMTVGPISVWQGGTPF